MKSGTHPTRHDHRDYDYLKTRKLTGVPATMPDNYSVDAGLRVPNQEAVDNNFNPSVMPMPYGCTNYAQCEICADEDAVLYNPQYLENITHANANGGADVRVSLDAVVNKGVQDQQGNINNTGHPAYFNIKPSGAIDAFDATRLAMLSTSSEKRGVSVGSPYWLQWNATGPNGITPPPDYDLQFASWHNWVVKGWKTIDNTVYLVCQMLQGASYGDKGFVYIPREVFNATIAVNGSILFTIDKLMPGEKVETISLPFIDAIVSYIRRLFNL